MTATTTASTTVRMPIDGRARRMFVDGAWIDAVSGSTMPTLNPATGEVLANVPRGSAPDIDAAVAAARRAFEGPWGRVRPAERQLLLLRIAEEFERHWDELSLSDTLDMGKPLSRSRADKARVTGMLRYYAGMSTALDGRTIDNSLPGEFFSYTRKEPVGVVGAIIPWNAPTAASVWKIGRLLVDRSIHDEFVERLGAHASSLKVGNGVDPETEIGPLVSARQLERVCGFLDSGREQGARVVAGGTRLRGGAYAAGNFVPPTVFADVDDEMTIATEEIFGPVISALPFDSVDEAVRRANATPYGLSAGVFTRDVGQAHRLANRLRAGTVWVNTYHALDPAVPFGGFKMSGYGKEGGAEHLEEYLETKTVWMRLD